MNASPYISEFSKKWYLWSANPCCLGETNDESNDKSQETRANILLAAFNEMYVRGFQAASLSRILQNTGITKGALYHHFDNKIELGYSVLDEVIRGTIRANWISPLDNSDDPITVLKNVLIQSGSLITEDDVRLGCPLNNLAQEMSPIDEGFRDRIVDIYQEWQDAIIAACDRGKASGNVKEKVDSEELALLFIASLQGCLGFAKSVQKVDTLMNCGQGLIDRLESLRPLK